MNPQQTQIPKHSTLLDGTNYDYIDSFRGDLNLNVSPTEIAKAFFSSGPKWIANLFALRNKIVALFGLKTGDTILDRQQALDNFICEPGDQMGLFQVFDKMDNEVILGEDDKHLNFRVSLLKDETNKHLYISTTVVYNNWFGKLYFLPVRPFHKLIVPSMLKATIAEVESNYLNP